MVNSVFWNKESEQTSFYEMNFEKMYQSIRKEFEDKGLFSSVLDDVLFLGCGILKNVSPKNLNFVNIKSAIIKMKTVGGKNVSPTVCQFVASRLPLCVGKESVSRHPVDIMRYLMQMASKDKALYKEDLDVYQKGLSGDLDKDDKDFFVKACCLLRMLIDTDAKDVMFVHPDDRLQSMAKQFPYVLTDDLKGCAKKSLYSFKADRFDIILNKGFGMSSRMEKQSVLLKRMYKDLCLELICRNSNKVAAVNKKRAEVKDRS